MSENILLPQITEFRLKGAAPLFPKDVEFKVSEGVNIVLGGNGLGKTTILQAIVYALTGGANEAIEEEKSNRWDHRFFKGRFLNSANESSGIEVHFKLGNQTFYVRRMFSTNRLQSIMVPDKGLIDGDKAAEEAWAEAVKKYGGYRSVEDFNFIVHRLLYMPESRQLLAWDIEAQTRLAMMLGRDVIDEHGFRAKRAQLKELDSRKRHVHVAIGVLQKELDAADAALRPLIKSETKAPAVSPKPKALALLLTGIRETSNQRQAIERRYTKAAQDLTIVSGEIETMRQDLEWAEAAVIAASIKNKENEAQLSLYQLIHNSICPACGTKSKLLQKIAQRHAKMGGCALCGAGHKKTDAHIETLQSRIAIKVRAQWSLQEKAVGLRNTLEVLKQSEQDLHAKINLSQVTKKQTSLIETGVMPSTPDDQRAKLAALVDQHMDLEAQCASMEKFLDDRYELFRKTVGSRMERLNALYRGYATSYLGFDCELVDSEARDRFLELKLLVPKFEDKPRPTPESCSEAQRFFLDIAFRLAWIELASSLVEVPGTFICETPENALDMSYVDNVAQMFTSFAAEKHRILLTANIQRDGLAGVLLHKLRRGDRREKTLNLLDIGRLSQVQKKAKVEMERIVALMFK